MLDGEGRAAPRFGDGLRVAPGAAAEFLLVNNYWRRQSGLTFFPNYLF